MTMQNKGFHKGTNAVIFVGLFLFANIAFAEGPDPVQMLATFTESIPNLMKLVTAIAYVLGLFFVVKGVIELKHLGESRTMMSREHGLKEPVIYMAVGAALLYLPSSVWVGLETFWTKPTPYKYIENSDQWWDFVKNCFMIIQLIGTIAFIRGLVILTRAGSSHGQQGEMGRGLTHIIAGIFCINIYQFIQVVAATFGLNLPIPIS